MAVLIIWLLRLLFLRRPKVVLLALLIGTVVGWRTIHFLNETESVLDPSTEEFLVSIHSESFEVDGDRLQFYGTIEQTEYSDTINENIVIFYTIPSKEEKEIWEMKDIPEKMQIYGTLEIPSSQRNPNQFDYASFLRQRQIHWLLEAEELESVSQIKNESKDNFSLILQLDKWRSAVLSDIGQRMSGKSADYIKMMLFADRRNLSQSVMENFQEIGIIHLLSISGLHIQLLIGGLEWILLRIGVTRERVPFLFVLLLPIYGTLAGWGTSVFRAVCQSWLVYASRCVSHQMKGLDAWSVTLILACFLNSYQIYSAGFQLSYALSLTLLLISSSKWYRRIPDRYTSFVTTAVLSLVSIPILSYHFFEFPWFSFIANLLFVPIFSWVVLPSLILLYMLSFLFSGADLFGYLNSLMDRGLLLVEWLVEKTSSLPGLTVVTGRLSWVGMVLVLIGLLFLFYAVEKSFIHTKTLLTFGVICFIIGISSQRYSPAGKVVMLDVGQGDSILIKQPFGKMTAMIDTGGQQQFEKEEWQLREEPYSIAEDVVIPVLKSFGIHSVNQVILTHSDIDHAGALLEISESVTVEELVLTNGTLKDEYIFPVASQLAAGGTKIKTVEASLEQPLVLQSNMGVLWPFSAGTGNNNDSIVLYGKIGTDTWLFTGDLEEEGERELMKAYPFLQADILKVGHHGSRTSTSESFLKKISPRSVLISCGRNNWYGHPHEEVLQRLEEQKTEIWRTDQNGGIVYTYYPWRNEERVTSLFTSTYP